MPDTPPSKRQRTASSLPTTTAAEVPRTQIPPQPPINSNISLVPPQSSPNPRKRRASHSPKLDTLPPGTTVPPAVPSVPSTSVAIPALLSEDSGKKKGRTNTPWTAAEEQRLKQMRDKGHSWSEIAKDMHYAEFAEDEVGCLTSSESDMSLYVQSQALRDAIREYEANKWKAIGQKLGKPAKACEQYAKEHFKGMI
ncbi:hypothetical protein DV736_g2574, partial [Chaetothyriales sp. CBS 134916]